MVMIFHELNWIAAILLLVITPAISFQAQSQRFYSFEKALFKERRPVAFSSGHNNHLIGDITEGSKWQLHATISVPNVKSSPVINSERYQGERLEISFWRVTYLAAIFGCLLNLPALDQAVQSLWSFLINKWWFQHDMFEPFLSVISLFVWAHGWLLADTALANSSRNGGRRIHRWLSTQRLKYRLQDRATIAAQSSAAVTELPSSSADKFSSVLQQQPQQQQQQQLPKMNRWYQGWYWEMAVYLAPLWAIATCTDIFSARRRALAWAAPKFLTVAGQILGGLFLYDFFFYFSHIAAHKLHPSVYRMLHGKHHSNAEVRASDTVRLTVPEEVIDVVCSIAALRLLKAHPLSRAIYDVVITFLLVELHCGYDMPWSPQNLVPQLFAGSRRHHYHHKHGSRYFQKFFKYLDDGADWISRVLTGNRETHINSLQAL